MIKLTTNHGDITIELFEDKAPLTCANFKKYVEDGHFNGTIFHRVIPNFMVQGGGFEAGMVQKGTRDNIKNEANNGLSNEVGTLAMARTPDPHSASSQFFINTKHNTFLDFTSETSEGFGYCVFAKITDGMDTIKAIEGVKTTTRQGHGDVPVEDVNIISAEII